MERAAGREGLQPAPAVSLPQGQAPVGRRPTLRQAGEFGLIERITALLQGRGPRPTVGIGDDAAAWAQPAATLVCSTDMLVEGIHFDLRLTGWEDLGWKALAVNLSDLAAMGSTPCWAFVSVALAPDTAVDDVLGLYRGMAALAERTGCTIAGGDTVGTPAAQVLSLAVLGSVPPDEAHTLLRRSAGRPGDAVAVTGTLGGSAAGLYVLQHPGAADAASGAALIEAHRRPEPQLAAGQILRRIGVRCAMDISDGLMADLAKLCAASAAGASVSAAALPAHPAAASAFPARALAWAAGGGEDYQLLFTAPDPIMADACTALGEQGIPASVIGQLTDQPGQVALLDRQGQPVSLPSTGWDHFAGGAA